MTQSLHFTRAEAVSRIAGRRVLCVIPSMNETVISSSILDLAYTSLEVDYFAGFLL